MEDTDITWNMELKWIDDRSKIVYANIWHLSIQSEVFLYVALEDSGEFYTVQDWFDSRMQRNYVIESGKDCLRHR